MHRTVQIDDDVYEFLRQHGDFGETESAVLRRLLLLPSPPVPPIHANGVHPGITDARQMIECPTCRQSVQVKKTFSIGGKPVHLLECDHILQTGKREEVSPGNGVSFISDGIEETIKTASCEKVEETSLMLFIADPIFLSKNRTDRYLEILAFAFADKGEKFDELRRLSGRHRTFYGLSRDEIEKSGTSTHPRPIPGSGYWAMTNADTTQKRQMLAKALQVLGYSREEIQAAAKAI